MADDIDDMVDDGEPDAERDARRACEMARMRMSEIIGSLEAEAKRRVGWRQSIENRWIEDLRLFHGRYPEGVAKALEASGGSQLFVNVVRGKTNALEARLTDMLFPTDDENWSIAPTPVPELADEAERTARLITQMEADLVQARLQEAGGQMTPEAMQAMQVIEQHKMRRMALQDRLDQAVQRAEAMTEEMRDQLKHCDYNAQCRDIIRDACQIGIGVMKGPAIDGRPVKRWEVLENGDAVLSVASENAPRFWRVDPWSFFPDPEARCPEEAEDFFERHLMTAKQLRALAMHAGFDQNAIRAVLATKAKEPMPSYHTELLDLTQQTTTTAAGRYHVWEYRGALTGQDFLNLCQAMGVDPRDKLNTRDPEDMAEGEDHDAGMDEDGNDLVDEFGADPLQEIPVTIWFCERQILSFSMHPLDSGEPIYSVFTIERDETSMFGLGIPYLLRHAQHALNAAWRAMMDNAGLASGPQIEVNQQIVEPADGQYTLTPRKVWLRRPNAPPNEPGIRSYSIVDNQQSMANIIGMARQFVDEESSMPQIAQGEQGAHVTKTAFGMSILMNSANIIFKRVVKNFDDDVTVPNIRRLYHWNMQFSTKPHIKGDFEVDAVGSSTLLVREIQAQNLVALGTMFTQNPRFAPLVKDMPLAREIARAHLIPADRILLNETEYEDYLAEMAAQAEQPDPEIVRLELDANLKEREWAFRMALAEMKQEAELVAAAAQMNISEDKLRAMLTKAREDRDSKERKFAGEIGMTREAWARGVSTSGGRF